MNDEVGGLVYLLNQAGAALAQANQRIAELTRQRDQLQAALSGQNPPAPASDSPIAG